MPTREEQELQEAVECVLVSDSPRKLIVAGPGAGKTTLFKKLLERAGGARDDRLVLTFINGLKADLDRSLGDLAKVYTLHAYCQYLLHQHAALRGGLTNDFVCYPQLASLIKKDWEWIESSSPPKFVDLMRDLACSPEQEAFYLTRSTYYDAVDFDDSVYQVYRRLTNSPHLLPAYDLVLIDEFQDFNRMEAAIIELLAQRSSIVVAGDDDQALYSQLRRASWDHIREHYLGGEYEVFHLPFCMRCPEVVVAAFGDVIENAKAAGKLQGRIDKPYRYFAPAKGEDSKRYPTIDLVSTSVQRQNANYFGRYIEKAIRGIGEAEFAQAAANHESAVLVIGARPYLPQIKQHLIEAGLVLEDADERFVERQEGLLILARNPISNLGWRIILACGSDAEARRLVRLASERDCSLSEVIPVEMRETVLHEANEFAKAHIEKGVDTPATGSVPRVKLSTYESAKGLSAQYVFLIGLHDGELPRDPTAVSDLEVCKFLVGLTRTKKKCTLMHTRRFGDSARTISLFARWIRGDRFTRIDVNASYWR